LGRRSETILIAGPTASGKSALALALAERLDGVVVNADSMQVYRELRILTARPTAAQEARAPHRLYGHVPAAERYSVGRWLADLADVLADCRNAGRPAILVGGTGLYFEAATRGLAEIPAVPAVARKEAEARAAALGPAALHGELARIDPVAASRLRPSDPQRLLRAYEVWLATGRPLSRWQQEAAPPLLAAGTWRGLALALPRALLYRRCDERLVAMLKGGALAEVEALLAAGLAPGLPAMKALGVGALAAHLAGECGLPEALAAAQRGTRNYAKRQLTWFRHRMAGWPIFDAQDSERLERQIFSFVRDDSLTGSG